MNDAQVKKAMEDIAAKLAEVAAMVEELRNRVETRGGGGGGPP